MEDVFELGNFEMTRLTQILDIPCVNDREHWSVFLYKKD